MNFPHFVCFIDSVVSSLDGGGQHETVLSRRSILVELIAEDPAQTCEPRHVLFLWVFPVQVQAVELVLSQVLDSVVGKCTDGLVSFRDFL